MDELDVWSTSIVALLVTSMIRARMVANQMWLGTDGVPNHPSHTYLKEFQDFFMKFYIFGILALEMTLISPEGRKIATSNTPKLGIKF